MICYGGWGGGCLCVVTKPSGLKSAYTLVGFDTISQGRQISPPSRPERSVQSASTRRLPAHDYAALITVNQLSIWRHRQQRRMARQDPFMTCCRNAQCNQELAKPNEKRKKKERCTYEELPPPSQWPWSPRTRYHSAIYKRYRVIIHLSHPPPQGRARPPPRCRSYPVVIGGVGVLITGNNFGRHPVRCADEGVSTADSSVQLSAHSKVNWMCTEQIR